MRQLDWKKYQDSYPSAFRLFLDFLETPTIGKAGTLMFSRMGIAYNYRDMVDFFDEHEIEYSVESVAKEEFTVYVADFKGEVFDKETFGTRVECEIWAIEMALSLLQKRIYAKWN